MLINKHLRVAVAFILGALSLPSSSSGQDISNEYFWLAVSGGAILVPLTFTGMASYTLSHSNEDIAAREQEILDELLEMRSNDDENITDSLFKQRYPKLYTRQETKRKRRSDYRKMSRQELLEVILNDLLKRRERRSSGGVRKEYLKFVNTY